MVHCLQVLFSILLFSTSYFTPHMHHNNGTLPFVPGTLFYVWKQFHFMSYVVCQFSRLRDHVKYFLVIHFVVHQLGKHSQCLLLLVGAVVEVRKLH